MNNQLTVRQVVYTYLFISISPVLRQIPSALAMDAGKSGYLSPVWSVLLLIPLVYAILLLIRSFPGLNLYEVMVQLGGRVLAKLVIFLYMLWTLLLLSAKLNIYALTLQFTLMPKTGNGLFMQVMLILVFYALYKGGKAVFRFSELSLGPVFLVIAIFCVCALAKVRTDYLLPVTILNLADTITASRHVLAAGGNIITALFFADRLEIYLSGRQVKKLWTGAASFIILSLIVTILTFGITGASLAAKLPFPFYITVKSISFFNILERFEVIVTLICMLSDYAAICVMFLVLSRLIRWLFALSQERFLFVPLAVVVYYLSFFTSSTQFEHDFLYRNVIVNLNMVFQYFLPMFFGFICLFKRKNIRKPY